MRNADYYSQDRKASAVASWSCIKRLLLTNHSSFLCQQAEDWVISLQEKPPLQMCCLVTEQITSVGTGENVLGCKHC